MAMSQSLSRPSQLNSSPSSSAGSGALGSTSLKADVLITTEPRPQTVAVHSSSVTPSQSLSVLSHVVSTVTLGRGVHSISWPAIQVDSPDTGRDHNGRGVVLVDLAITVVIDSVAVIIGSGIGLAGKAGAFFQDIWCCEGPVAAFNRNLRIGGIYCPAP